MLTYIAGMIILRISESFAICFLVMLPAFNLSNFPNLFTFTKDDLLSDTLFSSWESIKSFEFVRIEVKYIYDSFVIEVNYQHGVKLWKKHLRVKL